jgi:hypothetical protein
MTRALLILVVLAACGEDDEGGSTQQQGNATPAPAAAAPGTGSAGKQLVAQTKIEERVPCDMPPEEAKRCDPKLPATVTIGTGSAAQPSAGDMRCDPKLKQYCLSGVDKNNQPYFACGACPERDAIRYPFSPDRDFVVTEENRDPFQSQLIRPMAVGPAGDGLQKSVTARCLKKDQFRAENYSYKDLKTVGIVAQGTQRRVLMMDPGNLGHIIKPKDCVGKEKAVVSDIGDQFICFQSEPNQQTGEVSPPDCRPLRTPTVALSSQPSDATPIDSGGRTTITPVVAPPPTLPPRAPAPEKPSSRSPQAPPPAPTQAPTTIKP